MALRGPRAACCFSLEDDSSARNHRALWLGLSQRLDAQSMQEWAIRSHPFAGTVCFCVLFKRLEDAAALYAQGGFAETIEG